MSFVRWLLSLLGVGLIWLLNFLIFGQMMDEFQILFWFITISIVLDNDGG